MIVAIAGTKGGIGKTTLTIQLAAARARAGRRVWLVDGDRQGSAIAAITNRADVAGLPMIAAAHYPDGKVLRAQVMAQAAGFDDVLIDVGGRDSTALRAALILSDAVLVPFAPRAFDVWALSDIGNLIAEARSQRDGLRAMAVLNQADPGVLAADNDEAADAAIEVPELEFVEAPIRRRKAIATASALGLSVEEAVPRDPKACAEMAALCKALFNND